MLKHGAMIVGLSIAVVLTLAACGRSRNEPTPTAAAPTPAAEATTAETPAAEAATPEQSASTEMTATEAVTTEVAASEAVTTEGSSEGAAQISVTSEAFVGDVIDNKNPSLVTLSADGSKLVYPQLEGRLWRKKEGLCTYTFESAATSCEEAPSIFEGYPYAFFSSPDGATFTFTEDPIQLGNESDIWVFDTNAGTFNDLTNDNVEGNYLEDPTSEYNLDYLPMWSPDGDYIYFWRSVPVQEPITFTLQLMRIGPTGGEAELVSDLSQFFAGDLLYFNNEYWVMDGVSALSPDGTKIALIMTSNDASDSEETHGLWIVNVSDPSAAPQQVATQAALQVGQPSWSAENFPLVPVGLSWTADSSSVVVMTYNLDEQVPLVVLYDVNAATGEIQPVVDFQNVPDENTYMTVPVTTNGGEGQPMRLYSPWTASMSPDNNMLLMYQNLGGFAGIIFSPLPPLSTLPTDSYTSQIENGEGTVRSSRSSDGKVLMSNILFSTTQTK